MLDPNNLTPGNEEYEFFRTATNKRFVEYNYRHSNGALFGTITPTLKRAQLRRDKWISRLLQRPTSAEFLSTCEEESKQGCRQAEHDESIPF